MIRWVEKHKGTPGTRSDYRQINGWWLGTLCRIDDLAPGGRWHWAVFADDERGPNGTADDEQGAKDACKAALVRLLAEDEGLRALLDFDDTLGAVANALGVPLADRPEGIEAAAKAWREQAEAAEAAQRWIPVGERLPRWRMDVLCFTPGFGVYEGCLDELDGWCLFTRWGTEDVQPTHWRPLPAGPEVAQIGGVAK